MMKVAEATVKYLISKLGILVCWHNVWNKTKLWLGNLFTDTKTFEDGMEDFIGGDGAAPVISARWKSTERRSWLNVYGGNL